MIGGSANADKSCARQTVKTQTGVWLLGAPDARSLEASHSKRLVSADHAKSLSR